MSTVQRFTRFRTKRNYRNNKQIVSIYAGLTQCTKYLNAYAKFVKWSVRGKCKSLRSVWHWWRWACLRAKYWILAIIRGNEKVQIITVEKPNTTPSNILVLDHLLNDVISFFYWTISCTSGLSINYNGSRSPMEKVALYPICERTALLWKCTNKAPAEVLTGAGIFEPVYPSELTGNKASPDLSALSNTCQGTAEFSVSS